MLTLAMDDRVTVVTDRVMNPINYNGLHLKSSSAKVFAFEILDWIKENESISLEGFRKVLKGDTFLDDNGIRRYVANWFPTSIDEESICDSDRKFAQQFSKTGCFEIEVLIDSEVTNKHTDRIAIVKILSDWERLWNNLAIDNADEIAEHVPLLRSCVAFFMHQKTFLLITFLFIYNEVIAIWLNIVEDTPALTSTALFIYNLSNYVLYYIFYRLYVGNRLKIPPDQDHFEDSPSSKESKRLDSRRGLLKHVYSIHWTGSVRQLFSSMFSEMKSIFICAPPSIARKPSAKSVCARREAVDSFDQLMNIALKFLTRHCEMHIDDVGLNRTRYKVAFLTIVTVLPFVCILQIAFYWLQTIYICESKGAASASCSHSFLVALLSVGYLTNGFSLFLQFGALILSMIGLTYSSVLAYRMADCWVKRFSSLRRVTVGLNDDDLESSHSLRSPIATRKEREGKSSDEPDQQQTVELKVRHLVQHLTRDATEQYLFMVEYMRQAGNVWSSVIVGLYIYSLLLVGFVAYVLVIYWEFVTLFVEIEFMMIIVAEICMYLVFPTWSVAHANSFVAPVLDLFTQSSNEDFSMIGKPFVSMYMVNGICYSSH